MIAQAIVVIFNSHDPVPHSGRRSQKGVQAEHPKCRSDAVGS